MPDSERKALALVGRKLALAVALAAAAFGLLEFEARRAPTSFRQKRLGLEASLGAQVLVLGPSVAMNGVDPSVWHLPAYNLANNGQSLYYDRELLERWAPRLPALRVVLLGLARPSLRATVVSMNETGRGFAYRREFGIPHEDPACRADPRNFSAALALEPWKVLRWAWDGSGLTLSRLTPLGHEPLEPLSVDQQELQLSALVAQKHAQRQREMMTLGPDAGLAVVDAMLAFCDAHGLKAAVFVPPVTEAFGEAAAPGWAEELAAVKGVCALHRAGFHDYFRDPRFKDPDFADVDHLAAPAAQRFSSLLAADMAFANGASDVR